MRRAVLAAIMLALLIGSAVHAVSAQQPCRRVIEVSPHGLVYVYDEVPSAGEETAIGFPRDLIRNLVNYLSPNDPAARLVAENDTFSILIKSNPGEGVRLTTIFRGQLTWSEGDQSFQLRMPLRPIIPGVGRGSLYVEVRLPRDARILEASPGHLNQTGPGLLSAHLDEIDFSGGEVENLLIKFSSTSLRIIDVSSAKMVVEPLHRTIRLALRLRSLGGSAGERLALQLPAGSTVIEARDSVGAISSDYDGESGRLILNLRQPLSYGQNAYVEVSFKPPSGSSLLTMRDERIEVRPLLPLNTTAWIYEVEVILRGGSLRSWSPEPIQLRREYPETEVASYRFSHVDPVNVGGDVIALEYERGLGLFTITPYLAGAAILIFVAGAVTALYSKKSIKRVEGEPLRRLLDEGWALISVYQALADLISSERIYERGVARRAILEARAAARSAAERLRRLCREVEGIEPEASGLIREFEGAVLDFERAVGRAWDLVYPYLSGSLPRRRLEEKLGGYRDELRAAYDRLMNGLEALRRIS